MAAVRVASAGVDSLGTGGMATKLTAAEMASASGIPVLLAEEAIATMQIEGFPA